MVRAARARQKNAEAVTRFARSVRDAIDYMNADADRAKANVAAYTGLKAAFLKDMPLNRWSYRIDPAKWQGVADMMHASGELQRPIRWTNTCRRSSSLSDAVGGKLSPAYRAPCGCARYRRQR